MLLGYVCCLPNPNTIGMVHELFSSDEEEIEAFAQKRDGFGKDIYDCIGLFRPGETIRNKQTVVALPHLVVDLDLKNMSATRAEVLQILRDLIIRPTEVRDSGHGLHAIWALKEPLTGDAIADGERYMKDLVRILAGDPMPTHRAALLRRPGTHNTKDGSMRLCHVLEGF
jgi:hypothetical protein